MSDDPKAHWKDFYSEKSADEISWHQDVPSVSFELADAAGLGPSSVVIDVGAGTARFVDCLLDRGVKDVTALDVSESALAAARARLGPAESDVRSYLMEYETF